MNKCQLMTLKANRCLLLYLLKFIFLTYIGKEYCSYLKYLGLIIIKLPLGIIIHLYIALDKPPIVSVAVTSCTFNPNTTEDKKSQG